MFQELISSLNKMITRQKFKEAIPRNRRIPKRGKLRVKPKNRAIENIRMTLKMVNRMPNEVLSKLKLLTTSLNCQGPCRPSTSQTSSAQWEPLRRRNSGTTSPPSRLSPRTVRHRLWFTSTTPILPSALRTRRTTTRTMPTRWRVAPRKIRATASDILKAIAKTRGSMPRSPESGVLPRNLSCPLSTRTMRR